MLSSKAHTIIGLLIGILLLSAPWIFGFSGNIAATLATWLVGIVTIISELTSTSAISPLKLVSMRTHVVIDCLLGALLSITPWLFGFATAGMHVWLPHIVMGILIVGYAALTNPERDSYDVHAVV